MGSTHNSIAGQSKHQTKEKWAFVEHQQELHPAFKFSSSKCVHVNLYLFHGLILFLNRTIITTFPYSNYRNLISIPIELNGNFPVRFNGAVQEYSSSSELSPLIQQLL